MPKVTEAKLGSVFVREMKPNQWRASWMDPETKRHIRRMLYATCYTDAVKEARAINTDLAQGKSHNGRRRGSVGHTVTEAVKEAIKHTDASEGTRKDYLHRFNPFSEYLTANAKGIQSWADVNESVLENYLEHCRRQEVAHDTIRLRFFVLRLTSDYMSRTYPQAYRDVAGRIRIKRREPTQAELEAEESILSPEQLRGLLARLKERDRMVYTWAMLQGLCGLRLFEAAYLREQDYDPQAKTITITATPAHKPKNSRSYRTIPISPAVDAALREWILGLKVHHHAGFLFVPDKAAYGRKDAKTEAARVGALTQDRICHVWRDALTEGAKSEDGKGKKKEEPKGEKPGEPVKGKKNADLPECFTPRKLRATFVTAMREAGADFSVLQKYIGHAPVAILDAHYDKIGMDRLQTVSILSQALFEGTGAFKKDEKDAAKTGA